MFTRQRQGKRITDVICIGVQTESTKASETHEVYHEQVKAFDVVHFRPRRGELVKRGDIVSFECNDLFNCIHRYFDTGNNVLIVCNHSLPVIGGTDFTDLLECGDIVLHKGKKQIYRIGEGIDEEIESETFTVSSDTTIVKYIEVNSGRIFTLLDISNYGIKYMADIYCNLSSSDLKLISDMPSGVTSIRDSLNDCILIARFMQEYYGVVSKGKLGQVAYSYSSQGMAAFRGTYFKEEIVDHRNVDARILEGDCYLGGRIEEYGYGRYNGKCYLLDVRSLYPYLGAFEQFPVELLEYTTSASVETVQSWSESYSVFADCHVETGENVLPSKSANGLSFPVGSFRTCLCDCELEYAIRKGLVKKLYRAAKYRKSSVVDVYSVAMLDMRSYYKRNKNKLAEFIVKVITNGLWGKFGQHGYYWESVDGITPSEIYGGFYRYDPVTKTNRRYRVIDGEVSVLSSSLFVPNTFTPIAASINAKSRMYIWHRMRRAGLLNVLYVSVDGIIVNQEGYYNLKQDISNDEHAYGMFKLSEIGEFCHILGHGIYMIGEKVCYQGMPRYDEKRYTGFWSCMRDNNPIHDIDVHMGRKVVASPMTKDDRASVIMQQDLPWQFIYPNRLAEPIADTLPELLKNTPALLHQPEWLE